MKKRNLVGESIRHLRTEQNLTQEELALRSGLSQGYINQLENGKRKFTQKSLELVSKALSTPIMEFFRENDAFSAPLVKEEMAEYGGKPRQIDELMELLKALPAHIVEHYLTLLKMEAELQRKSKRRKIT
ncbi:MAG TPA: helix-turn-helix transcriptional regulator [Thermodesulfobacteriota bacterium]|nr:helix-turn-helix transcriptional regulator [Thermodesulfobacteriota bacterium]